MVTQEEVQESLDNREQFEIMLKDLKPEIQEELLEFLGIKSVEEGNYDTMPIAIIFKPEESDDE